MRMMPSIFGEDLFDEWMDFPFEKEFFGRKNPLYGKNEKNLMKTDVKETEDSFEIDIDLPGFKKENVTARLENGYLTIQASKGLDKDKEDKEGKWHGVSQFDPETGESLAKLPAGHKSWSEVMSRTLMKLAFFRDDMD